MGAVQDSYITIAWLVLLVVLLVIEIITVGLTTIWGAGGALAALILNILDIPDVCHPGGCGNRDDRRHGVSSSFSGRDRCH